MSYRRVFCSLLLFVSASCIAEDSVDLAKDVVDVDSLPAYNIDLRQTSVSGISSGGYMAQQFHTAYADMLIGVGVLAGGPYYCAENSVLIALGRCMYSDETTGPDPDRLAWLTREFAGQGFVADPETMAEDRVWLFSSPKDATVHQTVMDTLVTYYQHFVPEQQIIHVDDVEAGHSMVTRDWGHPCEYVGNGSNSEDVFINDCDYDAAGELLAHIYRRLRPRVDEPDGSFIRFPQGDFIHSPRSHGMDDHGYAYVPDSCEAGARCRVHVVFHGCRQYKERIGEVFFRNAGYNQWAERNRMIVLYPQTYPTSTQSNTNGCWDWWGYDDAHYMWRDGRQMRAVRKMIETLAGDGPTVTPPQPPSGLTVNIRLDSTLELNWTEVDDPQVQGYVVYESNVSGGPYTASASHIILEPTLTLSDGVEGPRYFVITSVGAQGVESVPTPELTVVVPGVE